MITLPLGWGNTSVQRQEASEDPPPYTPTCDRGHVATEASVRLQQIAGELGVSLSRIRPPLKPQDCVPTYLTDEDTQNALTLLAERRESDPEYKAPRVLSKITKSKAKLEEFSHKEINRAFRATVEENGSLGLVEAFLALGASVDVARRASTNMWKKVIKKDQTDVRNDVLQVATRGGSNQLVELLAGYADQQSRDEALLIAVYHQNLQKTQTLLEFDASIYEAHKIFLRAVDNGDTDLIELLLAAPKLPCRECRAKALVKAAATSCLRIVSALLFSDADTQHDDARAIKLAASRGDLAVCVAIAGSSRPPSPSNLDAAAGAGYRDIPDHRTRLSILEICLCGGARGGQTMQILVLATERNELDTIELLLQYGVSVDYQDGGALCIAISREANSLFTALLGASTNATTLGNGLVTAVGCKNLGLDFCNRLLERGASVNYDNAEPLVTAINTHANEILELLLSKVPSTRSMAIALKAALRLSGENRMAGLSLLLTGRIEQTALDEGLLKLVKEDPNDLEAIKALLGAGASADHKDGLCVVNAARCFEIRTLELLCPAVNSSGSIFSEAAAAVVAKNSGWMRSEGLDVLHFLLKNGASSSTLHDALCQAAVLFNLCALDFLAGWIKSTDIYTLAFAKAIEVGEKWHSAGGLPIIRVLLKGGAKGDIVDRALLQAQERYLQGRASESLIDTLLGFGADVNYDEGHAVEMAVKAGDIGLLDKLFDSKPSERTLSRALSVALISGHPVQKLLTIINALLRKKGEIANPNFVVPGMDPPIFLALQKYPTSVTVVERMLEIGCKVETKISFKVFGEARSREEAEEDDFGAENRLRLRTNRDDLRDEYDTTRSISARMSNGENGAPAEKVNVLTWACCQVGDQAVSSDVVDALLKFGANPNFATKYSKSTPLLLASRYERPDLVDVLVQEQIDVSVKDKFYRSALFFAAGNGDVRSTKILLQCKPRGNDGSLHEAARELHPKILSLLIKAGHDVNFTSTKHEDLTALGELAMYCNGKGFVSRIERCIELLVRAKLDPGKRRRGKTVLYMALDNPEPYPVTSALLERLMWKYITCEANIYHQGGIYYSPTMYLKKSGFFLGSERDKTAMIQLLKDHGAEDVYYAAEGMRQPPDALGMPASIAESERRRLKHEEDIQRMQQWHEESLRHQWKLAQQRFQLQEANQQRSLRDEEERVEQRQNHMISAAYTQAQIQFQEDLKRLKAERESARESARIQANHESRKLEVQWQSNRLQARENRDRVVAKQRLNHPDSQAERQRVARDHQINNQRIIAHGAVALIKGRSQAYTVAVKQQETRPVCDSPGPRAFGPWAGPGLKSLPARPMGP